VFGEQQGEPSSIGRVVALLFASIVISFLGQDFQGNPLFGREKEARADSQIPASA
jgi:hypothetical protein